MNEQLLSLLIKASSEKSTSLSSFTSWLDEWKKISGIPLQEVLFKGNNGIYVHIPESYALPEEWIHLNQGWNKKQNYLIFINDDIILCISLELNQGLTQPIMETWFQSLFLLINMFKRNLEQDAQKQALYMRNFILDHMSEMIAIKDKNMIFRYANPAAEIGFKNDLETIVNKSVDEVYPQVEVERIKELDNEAYDLKEPIKKTIKMLLSKSFIDAETERMIYRDQSGQPEGILTINRNISDRIKIEEQLKKSLSLQAILIKISLEFINVADSDVDKKLNEALKMVGEFIEADRVYVFDYDYDNYVTNNTYEWCYEGIEPMIDQLQGVPITDIYDDWYYPHSLGKTIYIKDVSALDHNSAIYQILAPQDVQSLLTIPLFEEETLTGFVGFDAVRQIRHWSDADQSLLQILTELIVHLKRNQRRSLELIKSREVAEEASRAKSIFLANMSHELRTPLSGLFNAISLIEETVTGEKQIDYINIAKTSMESFSTIINDILDFTRIEQKKMVIDETFFNLENEMYQLAKMQEYAILEKNLELHYAFDCKIRHLVKFDRLRLRQVILNLMNNAIKFTDHGSISLSTTLVEENDQYISIKFEVTDTGIGMEPELIERIYEPFEKGKNQQKRNFSGAGLGIPIIKGILSYYSSSLDIKSHPNQGSTFSFVIDFEKGDDITVHYQPLKGKQVLLITTEEMYPCMKYCMQTMSLKTMFMDLNHPKPLYEHNDYVIVMPGDQGIPSSKLEKLFIEAKKLDIKTILCVKKMSHYTDSVLSLPDYLIQYPMARDKFFQTLIHHQHKTESTQKRSFNDLSVLVVDDHKVNRQALEAMLQTRGCEVTLAENGFVAIDLIKSKSFDIVLMDIQMPGMDGYQTTKLIRDMHYSMDDLPIIAVSANRFEGSLEEALLLGLNGYLMKPFKMDQLMSQIEKVCNYHHESNDLLFIKDVKAFDYDEMMELFNHKMSIAHKIIDGFIRDHDMDIHHIKESLNDRNESQLRQHMHYFKGAAAYVTAHRIVHILDRGSELAKQEKWDELEPLIAALDKEYLRWKDAMEKALTHDVEGR